MLHPRVQRCRADNRNLSPRESFSSTSSAKQWLSISFVLIAVVVIATKIGVASQAADTQQEKPVTVFVVRHAEKESAGRNPILSEAGKERAALLAKTLRNAELDHIHSTDYARTMMTAAATAATEELQVEKYNPAKLANFAMSLKRAGGRHLVVGHSNTTPALVKLLGGDPGLPIEETAEYDRLYVVTIGAAGDTTCVLMRYGKSSETKSAGSN
ncbi:MAG: histidine phosphatase family protein [Fuerstiella sp.]